MEKPFSVLASPNSSRKRFLAGLVRAVKAALETVQNVGRRRSARPIVLLR